MNNSVVWALAFAFVGMCFAIALSNIYATPPVDSSVACVKAGGEWSSGFMGYCNARK